jgi:hypothetical protein
VDAPLDEPGSGRSWCGTTGVAGMGCARCLASFLPRAPELTRTFAACIASAVEVSVAEFALHTDATKLTLEARIKPEIRGA